MSGHSKWSSIKHKKAALDAKKGKAFTAVIKEITVAARMGGGDPAGNPRLRAAIANAKAVNMPQENVIRAIKKGTGELPGVTYEEVTYEGYGPGGVAMILETMTDNKNRTVAEMRHIFSKHNGNLGESGCVAWMFDKKGLIVVDADKADEDKLMEIALNAGAEDMRRNDDVFEIITLPEDLHTVREEIEKQGIEIASAEVSRIPKTTVRLEGKSAEQMIKLMEQLEEHDDVQHVFANFDIPNEIMERLGE
ncbi:MAG: YebC/PmpR family DNA-binding transcriptional regulator [bacterium]|nr:YebC/PmpR family DNA-binding transcriptional regulator [bacterium]